MEEHNDERRKQVVTASRVVGKVRRLSLSREWSWTWPATKRGLRKSDFGTGAGGRCALTCHSGPGAGHRALATGQWPLAYRLALI
jgi:hypothetical protein